MLGKPDKRPLGKYRSGAAYGKVCHLIQFDLGVALSEPLKKAKSAHLTTCNSVRDRPFT